MESSEFYPLISIILVVLNDRDNIEKSIQSVKSQSYANLEFIIIDGGSTDGTIEIIKNHQNIVWISEKDKGIYDAMNKGIGLSQGEILYFLGAGDSFVDGDVIRDIIPNFQQNDLVWGNAFFVGETIQLKKYRDISKKFFLQKTICHQAIFARKSVFDQIGLFDLCYPVKADYDWQLKVFKGKFRRTYIDRNIANFLIGGISTSKSGKNNNEYFKIGRKYFGFPLILMVYFYFIRYKFIKLAKLDFKRFWEY